MSHFRTTVPFWEHQVILHFFFFFVYKRGKKSVAHNTLFSGSVLLSDNCPISGTASNFTSSFFFFFRIQAWQKIGNSQHFVFRECSTFGQLYHFGNSRHQVIGQNVAVTHYKFLSYLPTLAQSNSLFPTFGPSTANKGLTDRVQNQWRSCPHVREDTLIISTRSCNIY